MKIETMPKVPRSHRNSRNENYNPKPRTSVADGSIKVLRQNDNDITIKMKYFDGTNDKYIFVNLSQDEINKINEAI
jgi:hypothetical protein